jgi:RNA polymerase sigma-70 factor (ECF subfamily)
VKNDTTKLSPEKFAMHMKGCVQNKRRSQKKIYKAFYEHAINVCNDYAASPEDAIEILNEGFLKIFQQVINYSPVYSSEISSFIGWMRKIMRYAAVEHYEKSDKHYMVSAG